MCAHQSIPAELVTALLIGVDTAVCLCLMCCAWIWNSFSMQMIIRFQYAGTVNKTQFFFCSVVHWMGGWFSSFLTFKTLLYKPKHLSVSTSGEKFCCVNSTHVLHLEPQWKYFILADINPDPFVLLSAAAEIAALHRSMEDTVSERFNLKKL